VLVHEGEASQFLPSRRARLCVPSTLTNNIRVKAADRTRSRADHKKKDSKSNFKMKNTLLVLYVTSLFTAIAVPAHAQSGSGMKLHGNIPFEFSVGDKPLPTGEYYVETRESRDSVRFLSADGQSVRSTNSNPTTDLSSSSGQRSCFASTAKRHSCRDMVHAFEA